MKTSRYFSELIRSYNDEIDDLVTDSEGKSVLQKRLNDKRGAIDTILPMIEFSPEMVSVVFYGAFGFQSADTMQQLVLNEPGDSGFLTWDELKPDLTVAAWAEPLIALSQKAQGGDAFLVSTAALEFLRNKGSSAAPVPKNEVEDERDEDADHDEASDEDESDLSEAGADWLAEQGFEQLDR